MTFPDGTLPDAFGVADAAEADSAVITPVTTTSETAPAVMRRVDVDARDRICAIRSPRIDAVPPIGG